MSRTVFCKKLNQEEQGLDFPPYPGELGQEIFNHISKKAWQQWLAQQTMLINEYRLNMLDLKSREFLQGEMKKFLFEGGCQTPPGYVPPEQNSLD